METIIAATDFSEPGNNAVHYAAGLAKHFNAKLLIINAFSVPAGGFGSLSPAEMMADIKEFALQQLRALKEQIIKETYDFGITCIAEDGAPFRVINELAGKYGADAVVMGMTGENGFLKKHLVGSSSLDVARRSNIPLFIVPDKVEYKNIENICFACDEEGVEESTLLHTARYMATAFNAEMEIVSVKSDEKQEKKGDKDFYSLVEKRLHDTKHKLVYLRDTNVARALEYYFKFHHTDLVMVNPKKHRIFQTVFGDSVTQKLAFSAEVPLLIVH